MSGLPTVGPFKIVVLGEGRVGKTSLLKRFVYGNFNTDEASTLSAAYLDKSLIARGKQVQLSLWDTAGQERFHALAPIYYRGASGALLVYDTTDMDSFRHVSTWVEELHAMGQNCALAIVGNKCDLRSQASVPQAEAEAYARSVGARFRLASAKLGHGVEEAFKDLAEAVVERNPSGPGMSRNLLVVDDTPLLRPRIRRRDRCCGGGGGRHMDRGDG